MQRRPLPAQPGPSGHTRGLVQTEADDDGRRGRADRPAAQDSPVRDADHQEIPDTAEPGRGGADRNVPCRRVRPPRGGHHGGAVGREGQLQHSQRAQPEDIRENRIMADEADRGRASVRVRRRRLPEAQLGRGGAERIRPRGRRSEFRRIP